PSFTARRTTDGPLVPARRATVATVPKAMVWGSPARIAATFRSAGVKRLARPVIRSMTPIRSRELTTAAPPAGQGDRALTAWIGGGPAEEGHRVADGCTMEGWLASPRLSGGMRPGSPRFLHTSRNRDRARHRLRRNGHAGIRVNLLRRGPGWQRPKQRWR